MKHPETLGEARRFHVMDGHRFDMSPRTDRSPSCNSSTRLCPAGIRQVGCAQGVGLGFALGPAVIQRLPRPEPFDLLQHRSEFSGGLHPVDPAYLIAESGPRALGEMAAYPGAQ